MREAELRHEQVFRNRWARPFALGWFVVAALLVVDVLRRELGGATAAALTGTALVTVVVYAVSYRPAVVIDDSGILLRNIVRDVYLPWPRVQDVDAEWVLRIEAEGRRYVAWAANARNPHREGRSSSAGLGAAFNRLGAGRVEELARAAEAPAPAEPAEPSEHVLERWLRWKDRAPDGAVRVTYQWPLLGLALVAALAFTAALLSM